MPQTMRIAGVIRLSRFDLICIDEAISYIQKYYRNAISADQLSLEVGINIKKLRSGIKKKTGYPLHEYHFKVRIEKAKDLLILTRRPLKFIASQVGFKNESHFCQKFRQFESMTPNQFRQNLDAIDIIQQKRAC
jgi:YesN/AraC family two-component response regulator